MSASEAGMTAPREHSQRWTRTSAQAKTADSARALQITAPLSPQL